MSELKDLISLLVTIELGVLAAALTLLALYPAIAALAHKTGISVVLGNELKRKKLFSWLGRTAVASGIGLSLLFCEAVFGVLIESYLASRAWFGWGVMPEVLKRLDQSFTWMGVIFTAISILAAGRAGRLIFTMASDSA